MTPDDKPPHGRFRAAANSPHGDVINSPHGDAFNSPQSDACNSPLGDAVSSSGRAAADAQGHRPPALAQLRALAGVADSPQTPHQIGKSANELTDLASVPLSQWQFGNTGTAHAVWQADSSPARQSTAGVGGRTIREPASVQATPGLTGAESARGGGVASPSWGPADPPQPVHLEIKVLGDGDSCDSSPASSVWPKADSVQGSRGRGPPAMAGSLVAGSFGFEAGYGGHSSSPNASHQSSDTAAAAVLGSAGMHGGKAIKALTFTAEGAFADGSDIGVKAPTDTTPLTASASASMQAAAIPAAQVPRQGGPSQHPVSEAGAQGLHSIGSAGADELAEAAAQMGGSPWDPRQGPKLLESLSDFSSFNSSLSMLQQLAGKSAAGLATLGIGSSSSSQRALEKKKSDKGHLISSAPTPWWRRRPGSAKKSPAPQVGPT